MNRSLILICGVVLVCLWAAGTVSAQVTVPGSAANMGAALAAVGSGGTITVTANLEEPGTYFVGSPMTIRGANPGITLRNMQFLVTAGNVSFRDLVVDGKNTPGQRNPLYRQIIRVTTTASDFTIENCRVVHPASGEGNGVVTDAGVRNSPGAALEIAMGDNVTIRNCDFVNDADVGIDNEVDVLFSLDTPENGPILIEDCSFAAHSRGIQINTPHANMTIRGNHFVRHGATGETSDNEVGGIFLATDFNPMGDPSGPTGTPMRNLVIEGNTFGHTGQSISNAGIVLQGPIEGVFIRNNVFNREVVGEAAVTRVYGGTVIFSDNVVRTAVGGGATTAYVIAGISSQLPPNDARAPLAGVLVTRDHFNNSNLAGIAVGQLVYGGRFEQCDFTDCAAWGVYGLNSSAPQTWTVRKCTFLRCGGRNTDLDGGLMIQSPGCAVLENVFIDGRDGVALDSEDDILLGRETGTDSALVAGNYLLRPTRYGIEDANGSDVDPNALGVNIRIANNTIVLPGIAAMALRSHGMDVYNNIMHGGPVAITTTTFAPTFWHRGYNLNFNNSYQGMSPAPTDLVDTNPKFVGGLLPTTVADLALRWDSPAKDAGTSDGTTPDYVSEIGAWQEATVDTGVAPAAWRRYR